MVVCNFKQCDENPPVSVDFPDVPCEGIVQRISTQGKTVCADEDGTVTLPTFVTSISTPTNGKLPVSSTGAVTIPLPVASTVTVSGSGTLLENAPLSATPPLADGSYVMWEQGVITPSDDVLYFAYNATDTTTPLLVIVEHNGAYAVTRTFG